MKILLILIAAVLATAARADVTCRVDGTDVRLSSSLADFNYSASGKPGATGRVSRFRLIAGNEGEGRSGLGIELKAVDVTTAGDYALADESGWRSVVRVQGKRQRVTGGKFHFSRFEVSGGSGRAAGTVEFTTEQARGSCKFDVEVQGIERDRLGL